MISRVDCFLDRFAGIESKKRLRESVGSPEALFGAGREPRAEQNGVESGAESTGRL